MKRLPNFPDFQLFSFSTFAKRVTLLVPLSLRSVTLLPSLCSASARATTNPRARGGDEDGVFGEFHRSLLDLRWMGMS
jgi:hypothetical protein